MTLFHNKDGMNKWEKKYFSLLDEHDAQAKSYQENEALLCKTINRLSLAATGFNSQLDPYLIRIRKQLKNGVNSAALKQELEEFSNALMTFDESANYDNSLDPTLLLEFLGQQYPQRQTEIDRIYQRYQNSLQADFPEFIQALHEVVDEERSIVSEIPQLSTDDKAIRNQLLQLLESTEIEETFSDQADQLKIRLQSDNEPLARLLDATFTLLLSLKKRYQAEQQAIKVFLARLREQLGEIGQQTMGVTNSGDQEQKKKNLLDRSFSSQLEELRRDSVQTQQLDALQQLLDARLGRIMEQIQSQQQREQLEHNKQRLTLQQLLVKIQRLESESSRIESRFDQAREQAFQDSMTGLPNRLAYDEKLEELLTHRKRSPSPLTLLIWDIDCFSHINRSFGQKSGDNTLKIIARLLQQNCRKIDYLFRFGGDEFVMLLPETNARTALSIADSMRGLIENTGFNASGKKIAITLSCGISEFSDRDDGERVFKRAEQALQGAKKNGRNRCIIG